MLVQISYSAALLLHRICMMTVRTADVETEPMLVYTKESAHFMEKYMDA